MYEGIPKSIVPRAEILVEREKTHGPFKVQGAFAHRLKVTLRSQSGFSAMRDEQREALEMIATKISRLLHGSSMTKDTWDDIAGYAKLGAEACE